MIPMEGYGLGQAEVTFIDSFSGFSLLLSLACLSVCLYPKKNVKTAEPIGPTLLVIPHMTPGKVYEWWKFQKFASNNYDFKKIHDI